MDPVIPIKPETMHALLATSYGSPSKWEQLYIPLPALQTPTDILIRVHASDINPADARIAGGEFRLVHHIAFPVKLGFDFSGTVVMVGDAVRNFRVGDQVFGMLWMDRAGELNLDHTLL
jgi:NADPH:quinone reductase-like Zn-dependent oxidoreductase